MVKRNIVLLFACMAVAGSMSAQVRPGLKMGYNLGGVIADYAGVGAKNPYNLSDPDNFHMKSGFQAGLIADCPISDALAIQPGARFSMQGFVDKYQSGASSGPEVIRKFSFFYLQVPVYAQYRLNIAEETNLLFQAGPYAGIGLFGRQSITTSRNTTLSDDNKKITFGYGKDKDIYNAFDYGVSAGVGIEFVRFQLLLAYDFGLNKMNFDKPKAGSGPYNVQMNNHNFSITLAVIFGRRDPLQNKTD